MLRLRRCEGLWSEWGQRPTIQLGPRSSLTSLCHRFLRYLAVHAAWLWSRGWHLDVYMSVDTLVWDVLFPTHENISKTAQENSWNIINLSGPLALEAFEKKKTWDLWTPLKIWSPLIWDCENRSLCGNLRPWALRSWKERPFWLRNSWESPWNSLIFEIF